MENSENTAYVIKEAIRVCYTLRHEFLTPEHVLFAFNKQQPFINALNECGVSSDDIRIELLKCFNNMETVPQHVDYNIDGSEQFSEMMCPTSRQHFSCFRSQRLLIYSTNI